MPDMTTLNRDAVDEWNTAVQQALAERLLVIEERRS
jgi:hypothetical protein